MKNLKDKLLFFDTETTGVSENYNLPSSNLKNWPRMVQLAWIVSDISGNMISRECHIIYPEEFIIPDDSIRIHGITNERAKKEGEPLKVVLESFYDQMIKSDAVVGHNVSFDIYVVGAEMLRCGMKDTISNVPFYCTMQLSTKFCNIAGTNGRLKWPTLQELYLKLFNKNYNYAHDAMADIEATFKCFF